MNGDCYIVHDGIYAGAAALAVLVVLLTLAVGFAVAATGDQRRPGGEGMPSPAERAVSRGKGNGVNVKERGFDL